MAKAPSRSGSPPGCNDGTGWTFHRHMNLPPRLAALMAAGEITVSDLLIMWFIDSLVKPHGDGEEQGCWATNGYIAGATNTHPN
jgi:hypothetical protein